MINSKVFAEYLKLFLINYGFEMNKEDLLNYCSLCYSFFNEYYETEQFIKTVKTIIFSYGKEEIKNRPSARDFYNLIKQNIELNEKQKAEIEYNKILVKKKYNIHEVVNNTTLYLVENFENIIDDKKKFIDSYIEAKNNKKLIQNNVFLLENRNKKEDEKILKKLNELIESLKK